MSSWSLEHRERDKHNTHVTSDKCYKGKEQIAVIGGLMVIVIKKGLHGGSVVCWQRAECDEGKIRLSGHEGYRREFHGKEFLFYWKSQGNC